ncbi:MULTISPECIES: hypothetical protein [Marinobacter]|uniref:Integrase SAM-like N-terminal domain-containing protein n=1 Tax=Marinobacter sp. MMG032 TaxID=3158548 RepID=A0AAU7MPK0_9GAMM
MTPLRQTMIQAMCQHGFSPRTQQSYLYAVTELARYYRPVAASTSMVSGFCICKCFTGRILM